MAHQSVFSGVAAAGEVMQSIMKRFGLREGAKEWGKYVAQQVRTFKAFKSDSKKDIRGYSLHWWCLISSMSHITSLA